MEASVERRNGAQPSGPPGIFGLRNLVRFVSGPLGALQELKERHGDVVRMKVLGRPWLMFSHPDDIETLVVKNARVLLRDAYMDGLQRALGMGLLTSDGELWKRQRKLMAQAFTPRRIAEYAETMVRVTDAGIASWRDGQEINLHQEMSRITMEVVAEVLFGASVTPADVVTVGEAMEVVNEFFANSPESIFQVPAWLPTPRNARMNRAVKQLDELIYAIIAKRRASAPREDFLGTLLAAQDDAGVRMSDQQLRDEAMTLFLAGHETTALTMAHTFYLLSKHPDVERRLFAELSSVLGDRLPRGEDAKALPYVERVLKESMRLYPPAWTLGREAAEDIEVGGVHVPKGAQILLSQWIVHRDPRWFPNPEGFDPDRWTPERTKALPRYAYFPFGGGPRTCIGNHFAMMEATMLLAVIARRFRIELLPNQELEVAPSVTLRPRGPGLRARLVERDARALRAASAA